MSDDDTDIFRKNKKPRLISPPEELSSSTSPGGGGGDGAGAGAGAGVATPFSLFTEIRDSQFDVMDHIYSFSSPMERFNKLRPLDRTFRNQHKVIGIYGDQNLDIHQAWQYMKDYLLFLGSPDAVRVKFGRHLIWQKALQFTHENFIVRYFHSAVATIYNPATGLYNVNDLRFPLPYDEDMRLVGYKRCLQQMNDRNAKLRVSITAIESEIEKITTTNHNNGTTTKEDAGFNALFSIVTSTHIEEDELVPFYKAGRGPPSLRGPHPHSLRYEIIKENGNIELLEHLLPARKLIYMDPRSRLQDGGKTTTTTTTTAAAAAAAAAATSATSDQQNHVILKDYDTLKKSDVKYYAVNKMMIWLRWNGVQWVDPRLYG